MWSWQNGKVDANFTFQHNNTFQKNGLGNIENVNMEKKQNKKCQLGEIAKQLVYVQLAPMDGPVWDVCSWMTINFYWFLSLCQSHMLA